MYTKEEFPYHQSYDQCPKCGRYRVAKFVLLFTYREEEKRPDGWRRFLPWNWLGPMESKGYTLHQCKNCRYKVKVEDNAIEE